MSKAVHQPATMLPWFQSGQWAMAAREQHSEHVAKADAPKDAAYIAHAANAYPKLVQAMKDADCGCSGSYHRAGCFKVELLDVLRDLGEAA